MQLLYFVVSNIETAVYSQDRNSLPYSKSAFHLWKFLERSSTMGKTTRAKISKRKIEKRETEYYYDLDRS